MNRGLVPAFAAALAVLPMSGAGGAPGETMKIGWNDLRPADEAVEPGARTDPVAGQKLSWDLEGKSVEIAGYVLPSDREGDLVYQFVLIPWTGLCAHIAAPPANQAILINLKKPFKLDEIYEVVSVTGVIEPELAKTQLFILDGVSVIESGYRIAGARIAPANEVTGATPQPKVNPWSFVRK